MTSIAFLHYSQITPLFIVSQRIIISNIVHRISCRSKFGDHWSIIKQSKHPLVLQKAWRTRWERGHQLRFKSSASAATPSACPSPPPALRTDASATLSAMCGELSAADETRQSLAPAFSLTWPSSSIFHLASWAGAGGWASQLESRFILVHYRLSKNTLHLFFTWRLCMLQFGWPILHQMLMRMFYFVPFLLLVLFPVFDCSPMTRSISMDSSHIKVLKLQEMPSWRWVGLPWWAGESG